MKSTQKTPSAPELPPGQELYNLVRAGFVIRSTTFTRWCEQHQVNRQNATQALLGAWNGPKAKMLRQRLLEASGVQKDPTNG